MSPCPASQRSGSSPVILSATKDLAPPLSSFATLWVWLHPCHPERSEGSRPTLVTLRCAQDPGHIVRSLRLMPIAPSRPASSRSVGAIAPYMSRLRRSSSFCTCLCVFCVRWYARKIHTNRYYNVWSPQATHLYRAIAPTVQVEMIALSFNRFIEGSLSAF